MPPMMCLCVLISANLNSATCRHLLLKRSYFSVCFQKSTDWCVFFLSASFSISAICCEAVQPALGLQDHLDFLSHWNRRNINLWAYSNGCYNLCCLPKIL